MPEIYLTQADRKRAKREKLLNEIGNGLAVYKKNNHRSNQQLASMLGFGHPTIKKILDGEALSRISTEQFLDVLELSGMEIRKRRDVKGEISNEDLSNVFKSLAKKLEAG